MGPAASKEGVEAGLEPAPGQGGGRVSEGDMWGGSPE